MTIPVLIIHGDDDQIVPLDTTGKVAGGLLPQGELVIIRGASRRYCSTHKDEISELLPGFIKS